MHPFYLNDYINRVIRDTNNDKLFITQGVQSIYTKISLRHKNELQWRIVELANAADEYLLRLKNLEQELDKAHESTKI